MHMLAQLQWPIQITTAKKAFGRVLISEVQYYHVSLPMSIAYLHAVIHSAGGRW